MTNQEIEILKQCLRHTARAGLFLARNEFAFSDLEIVEIDSLLNSLKQPEQLELNFNPGGTD